MSTWIFVYNVVFSALAVAVAFLPLPTHSRKWRWLLIVGMVVALVPVVLTAVLGFYPQWAVAVLGLDTYAQMEWEYWMPFAVLLFALASHRVPRRSRRALVLLSCAVAVFAVQQKAWHVMRPAVYDQPGKLFEGVFRQTSGYTCGAASAATMLHAMGVDTNEGEMAELTRTPPRRGITSVAAAYGVKRKLAQVGHPGKVSLVPCADEDLDRLPTPFIVGLRFTLWCDHMVCVQEVRPDKVLVGDPLVGNRWWDRPALAQEIRGLAVIVER